MCRSKKGNHLSLNLDLNSIGEINTRFYTDWSSSLIRTGLI